MASRELVNVKQIITIHAANVRGPLVRFVQCSTLIVVKLLPVTYVFV